MITLENASLSYQNHLLFDRLSLQIETNKITCLLGRSGVGKSSLLRLIAGLIQPDENITFTGKIICEESISYMAQTDLLLPWLSALNNVTIGYRLRNNLSKEILSRAKAFFTQMNLENALHKYPHELSGGMRQRVALIRTLLENKSVILMDEPFSSLDAITRMELQTVFVKLLKNKTVFMVTHDPIEALRIADEVMLIAGNPAKINARFSLHSKQPRNLNDLEVLENISKVYGKL